MSRRNFAILALKILGVLSSWPLEWLSVGEGVGAFQLPVRPLPPPPPRPHMKFHFSCLWNSAFLQITNKMDACADKLSWRDECRRILLFISAIFQVGAWDPGRCYIVLHYGTFSGSNLFSYWQLQGFRVNKSRIRPPKMLPSAISNNAHPVSLTTLKMVTWSYGHILI